VVKKKYHLASFFFLGCEDGIDHQQAFHPDALAIKTAGSPWQEAN